MADMHTNRVQTAINQVLFFNLKPFAKMASPISPRPTYFPCL